MTFALAHAITTRREIRRVLFHGTIDDAFRALVHVADRAVAALSGPEMLCYCAWADLDLGVVDPAALELSGLA